MVSRRQRRGCVPLHPRAVLDLQLHCQVLQLWSQLSQGSAASSNDRWRSIIKYSRVSAGMVANALRFTDARACIARLSVILAPPSGDRARPFLRKIRPNIDLCDACEDPSRELPLRRRRLSQLQRLKQGQPLARRRPPDAKGRASRRPTDRLLAVERRAARSRPPTTRAAPPNKEGSLSRRRPPEEDPLATTGP